MFWRNKTAIQHQAAESLLSDGKGQIKENFVRQPANVDAQRGDIDERALVAELGASERCYVVPRSHRISGAIVTSRAVVVEGQLTNGSLDAPAVLVAQGGRLAVPTQASKVFVQGEVNANLSASVQMIVGPRGAVKGTLNAPSIQVEPGAQMAEATLCVGPKR